jgi:hypothetical protein
MDEAQLPPSDLAEEDGLLWAVKTGLLYFQML